MLFTSLHFYITIALQRNKNMGPSVLLIEIRILFIGIYSGERKENRILLLWCLFSCLSSIYFALLIIKLLHSIMTQTQPIYNHCIFTIKTKNYTSYDEREDHLNKSRKEKGYSRADWDRASKFDIQVYNDLTYFLLDHTYSLLRYMPLQLLRVRSAFNQDRVAATFVLFVASHWVLLSYMDVW